MQRFYLSILSLFLIVLGVLLTLLKFWRVQRKTKRILQVQARQFNMINMWRVRLQCLSFLVCITSFIILYFTGDNYWSYQLCVIFALFEGILWCLCGFRDRDVIWNISESAEQLFFYFFYIDIFKYVRFCIYGFLEETL